MPRTFWPIFWRTIRILNCVVCALVFVDLTTWRIVSHGLYSGSHIQRFEFTRDGETVVGGGLTFLQRTRHGDLCAWDVKTGRKRWQKTFPGQTPRFALAANGRNVAVIPFRATVPSDGPAQIFDVATGRPLQQLQIPSSGDAWNVALSADGRRAALYSASEIALFDVKSAHQKKVFTYQTPDSGIKDVKFARDGTGLIVTTQSATNKEGRGSVELWSAESGRVLRTYWSGMSLNLVTALSPDGTRLAAFAPNDARCVLWVTATGKRLGICQAHMSISGTVDLVTVLPDNDTVEFGAPLLAQFPRNDWLEWHTARRHVVILPHHEAPALSMAVSPDGIRRVYGSNARSGPIGMICDNESGADLGTLEGTAGW
jgi:WD40 repeat protein